MKRFSGNDRQRAPDKELTHIRKIAETGRNSGYKLATHLQRDHPI
jgi:hypothetical protein